MTTRLLSGLQLPNYGAVPTRSDDRIGDAEIQKKKPVSTLSDLYAAATKARNCSEKHFKALGETLKNFDLCHLNNNHMAMLTHWELELVASDAGDKLPKNIREMIANVKTAFVKKFSSPDAYNRQRDHDLERHAERPCLSCRFAGIR